MPYGILKRADVADVMALANRAGRDALYSALKVAPDATIAEFDARHPDGADYVIVPPMTRDDDRGACNGSRAKRPRAQPSSAFAPAPGGRQRRAARRQARHDPLVFGEEMRGEHPSIRYVPDRRLVVETGRRDDDRHHRIDARVADADRGYLRPRKGAGRRPRSRPHALGCTPRQRCLHLQPPLRADRAREPHPVLESPGACRRAVTRHRRSLVGAGRRRLVANLSLQHRDVREHRRAQQSRNGIRIFPDKVATNWPAERLLPSAGDRKPAEALDDTLRAITARYGARTTDFVAMQLEYREVEQHREIP